MNLKRILLLAPASNVHTKRWANALASRDLEVSVLTCHPDDGGLDKRVMQHRFTYRKGLGYFLAASVAREIWKKRKPDIIHAHHAVAYGTLARLSGIRPSVVSAWGSDVYIFPSRSFLHRRLLRRNLAAADIVCATGKTMAAYMQAAVPTVSPKVVPFGIDTNVFKPRCSQASESEVITIGTIKALEHVYGVDDILRSFALVQTKLEEFGRRAPRVQLRIVGKGRQRAKLEELSSRLGVRSATTFVGWVPHQDVVQEFHRLDIYAAASRSESFGVATLEASACGIPVVISNVGGVRDVVVDGETGFLIPPGSPEEMATAIVRLVCDPEMRRRFGRNGRAFVQREFEWATCVDRMVDLYRDLHERALP